MIMAMITQVFTVKNQTETISSAYTKLIALNPTDKYIKQKAAGSLGGSSHSHFIERNNGQYTRKRQHYVKYDWECDEMNRSSAMQAIDSFIKNNFKYLYKRQNYNINTVHLTFQMDSKT